MQHLKLRALLIIMLFAAAGCASTRPADTTSTTGVGQDAASQEAFGGYRIEQAEVMGADGQKSYALGIETPALPEQLINDLVARYGDPTEVLGPQNTWRSVTVEGIDEPVTLVISFNSIAADAGTFYTTFVQAQAAGGADLLVPGSATREVIEAYLQKHVQPAGGVR